MEGGVIQKLKLFASSSTSKVIKYENASILILNYKVVMQGLVHHMANLMLQY